MSHNDTAEWPREIAGGKDAKGLKLTNPVRSKGTGGWPPVLRSLFVAGRYQCWSHELPDDCAGCAFHADSSGDPETMNFREKKLYHQIHPLKLATDIGVTPIFLFFLWHIVRALLVGFVPPALVSAAMMIWPPDLERLKNSSLGKYVSKHMTPTIEAVRSVYRPSNSVVYISTGPPVIAA